MKAFKALLLGQLDIILYLDEWYLEILSKIYRFEDRE